jgi:transcriptional regulator with XRE-family HTH domain
MIVSTISEPKLDWIAFGQFVAELRKRQGLSQVEFAELIGRKQPDVSVIEKGSRQSTVETIWRIADALEVAPQKLFSKLEKK